MSFNRKHLYRFGDFSLDVEENVLRRKDVPLLLTPKMLELLRVLIVNRGQIVDKEELLKTVWAGSFVERGSLTFTVNQLRKILEDNARYPTYIETVPRRGYRFIAETKETFAENEIGLPVPGSTINSGSHTDDRFLFKFSFSNFYKILVGLFVILLASTFFVAARYFTAKVNQTADAPILLAPQKTVVLSETGNVFHPRISPDGKYMAYISINQGKQAIWIRDLDTSDNLQLLPYSDDEYLGLMFSPGSDFVYFGRRPRRAAQEQAAIFRISRIGGVPAKLLENTQGWFSLSPEGKIAFVRNETEPAKRSTLMTANADGNDQRIIAVRQSPYNFRANRWSPDGKTIAYAVGESYSGSNDFELKEIDVESGEEREITPHKFFYIEDLAWLPNRSGLLLTARENFTRHNKIWEVSRSTGEAVPIRQDSIHYGNLSLDNDATKMVVGQVLPDFHLRISEMGNPARALLSSSDSLVSYFTPSGKIVYSSNMNGQSDIWIMNSDGTDQRQLTNDPAADTYPRISHDEKYIFFTSNRSGSGQIWRMNLDGSDQRQITVSDGGNPIFASPDNSYLYYRSLLNGNLWKVPFNGGGETLVLDRRVFAPAFSPDGKLLAYFYREKEIGIYKIAVVSLENMTLIQTFDQPNPSSFPIQVVWASDSRSFYYPSTEDDLITSLWRQALRKNSPQKIADLGTEEMQDFSMSPDNTKFAVVSGKWSNDASLILGLR